MAHFSQLRERISKKSTEPFLWLPNVLEKVVALQIEEYFEKNNLLGKFQFGFQRNRSMISELLTLFDTIMEAKETKKKKSGYSV